jgi:hypothetical protein
VGLERGLLSLRSTMSRYFKEIVAAPAQKAKNTAVEIHQADHATPLYPQKLALTLLASGCRSVCIVCSRTQATELLL